MCPVIAKSGKANLVSLMIRSHARKVEDRDRSLVQFPLTEKIEQVIIALGT